MRPTSLYSIILSLVAFLLAPKYMTLHDLEILNALNFHYWELTLSYYLLIYCRLCLHTHVTSRDCGGGVADRDPQNIRDPQEDCGFYRTLWLIYPRHCISISIKISQVYGVFLCPTVYIPGVRFFKKSFISRLYTSDEMYFGKFWWLLRRRYYSLLPFSVYFTCNHL